MKNVAIIAVGGLVASLLIIGVWSVVSRIDSQTKRTVPHGAVLIDPSNSRRIDCSAVVAETRRFIASPAVGKGSKFFIFTTGDASSAEEPILLYSFDVPFTRRVQEGKKKIEVEVLEIIQQIKERCGQIKQTKSSPIALGIQRVIDNLRSLDCNEQNECVLSVQSDLQELSEQNIKAALAGKTKVKAMKNIIDNTGVAVLLCGEAQRIGLTGKPQTLEKAKLKEEVWHSLFTKADIVKFSAYCETEN